MNTTTRPPTSPERHNPRLLTIAGAAAIGQLAVAWALAHAARRAEENER